MPVVAHTGRTRADFGPDRAQRALLTDTGLVLEPDLERFADCVRRQARGYDVGEVFLNASCASRSRLGLYGRGCSRVSSSRRNSLPTVRS